MPTALEKRLTPTQRAAEAARQAAELLGCSDTKTLAVALAEAAVEAVRSNSAFAEQVRTRYAVLSESAKPRRSSTARVKPDIELVPIKHVGAREANPGAAPDPYFLLELYGADQLTLALGRYKVADLKLAVQVVQQRNPGTKPTNKSSRDALIEYIVLQVAATA